MTQNWVQPSFQLTSQQDQALKQIEQFLNSPQQIQDLRKDAIYSALFKQKGNMRPARYAMAMPPPVGIALIKKRESICV